MKSYNVLSTLASINIMASDSILVYGVRKAIHYIDYVYR